MTDSALITVVTGLPRSGTSMMMHMLAAGGCDILTDNLRPPDASNPNGYFEYEPVKRLPMDSTWLPQARGKALKVVAPLLPYLPLRAVDNTALLYRVIFMVRPWEDVAASQSRMLENLDVSHLRQPEPQLRRAMLRQQEVALAWLAQHDIPFIEVDYRHALGHPAATAATLATLIPTLRQQAAAAVIKQTAP